RIALAPAARLRRMLERARDAPRVLPREDAPLEVERVAGLGHALRPAARRARAGGSSPGRGHVFSYGGAPSPPLPPPPGAPSPPRACPWARRHPPWPSRA